VTAPQAQCEGAGEHVPITVKLDGLRPAGMPARRDRRNIPRHRHGAVYQERPPRAPTARLVSAYPAPARLLRDVRDGPALAEPGTAWFPTRVAGTPSRVPGSWESCWERDIPGSDHPKLKSAHDGEAAMAPTGGHNRALSDARRARRLTQGQLAERVSARLGVDPPLDGNYISKLERGVHTWPNGDYRRAFREELGATTDAELGFHCSRSVPSDANAGPPRITDPNTDSADVTTAETTTSAALRWLVIPAVSVTPKTGVHRQVRHGDVARLRAARSQLKALDNTMGGAAAYPPTLPSPPTLTRLA